MKIAGFLKQSFVDYPGKIAAAVFTQGCNMNCVFCHNRFLVGPENLLVDEDEVYSFLYKRNKFLDGVVVSGGEPSLQPDLEAFVRNIKRMGYQVKLDTNGTRPGVLKKLIARGLVDYVAMDVKAPMKKYPEICGCSVDRKSILDSISILMASKIDYEFRTTCCPQLSEADIGEIGELISGAKKYVLQQYRETDETYGGYTGKKEVAFFHEENYRELENEVCFLQVRGEFGVHPL